MYNCVAMREREETVTRETEIACVPVGDGHCLGFMGQRWEAHVGPCRCIVGCTQRECSMRRERRGGVTTCCKSLRTCGRTQGRMSNSSHKWLPFMCVQHRSHSLCVWRSLPWSLVSVAVAAKQQLRDHILLSWTLSVPGREIRRDVFSHANGNFLDKWIGTKLCFLPTFRSKL